MAQSFQELIKIYFMADDPKKKGADAKRVSQQPHEQTYQRKKKAEANRATGKGKKG